MGHPLGATGARLYVEEGVVSIHLAVEHTAEFQLLQLHHQAINLRLDFLHRGFIVLCGRHLQQVAGIDRAAVEPFDSLDDTFQRGAFTAQFLGAIRVVPDAGLGEFEFYLGEAFLARIEVKDTP